MSLADAATALLRRLEHARAGVVTVELERLSTTALLQVFRGVDVNQRVALIEAGRDEPAATLAFGVAAVGEGPAEQAVRAIVGEDRIAIVAVPFASSSSLRRVWAPRVWLRQGSSGPTVLGVDVVDGEVEAATDLVAALAPQRFDDMRETALAAPSPPTPLPLRGRGAKPSDVGFTNRPSSSCLDRVDLPDRAGHAAAVDDVLATIARGEASKVVLARRSRLGVSLRGAQVDDVLAGLLSREQRGTAYLFVEHGVDGDDAFFGCSPERLCVRRGRQLDVDALAGTAPRGATAAEDDALADRLRSDGKERREHAAVVEAITQALLPLSTKLDVADAPDIVRLGRVQHLHTPIRATLVDDAPVFAALHPTPAVAGTPRHVAVETIARLEPFSRGLYAGYVGVADSEGEHLTVALRCGHAHDVDGRGVVDVFAGSGLVEGAVAEREWRELDRKAALVLEVVADVVAGLVHG